MDASRKLYDATMGALGYEAGVIDARCRCVYRSDSGVLMLSAPLNGEAACGANGGTVGFKVDSSDADGAWHAAGVANGGIDCEDPRPAR